MQDVMRHAAEIEAGTDAKAAMAGLHDALRDIRARAATIGAAIDRQHLTGLDAIEALQGIETQAERLLTVCGQVREAQRKAARAQ